MKKQDKADRIGLMLDELYPEQPIPLDHRDPYTLLVAVALSAQTTDKKVNQVTPALFAVADTPEKMAALGPERILELIREIGLAPTKAKNLWTAANQILDAGGEVLPDWAFLESLAGVGHKTASVVMSQAYGVPGVRRRHPHPPPGGALGPVERHQRRAHRSRPEGRVPDGHMDPPPPADHLLRPRVLPGAAARPGRVPDLLVGVDEEAPAGRGPLRPRLSCGRAGR